MATCKDCVHYEVCKGYLIECAEHGEAERILKPCTKFKNKADFVEIPCRCKECEHFINYNPDRTYCAKHSDVWSDSTVYVDKDDYCSFGIRKKEGADNAK